MRVKHRTTGQTGAVVSGEPEYVMGEPTWAVLWDDHIRSVIIADDDLIVISR